MLNRIREIRNAKGMTIRELSDATGLTEGTIGNAESGRNSPALDNARKIAEALGVTLDELLIETQDSKTDNVGTPSPTPKASGSDSGQVEDEGHTAATDSE